MPLITISQSRGSEGMAVALQVAERLDMVLYDRGLPGSPGWQVPWKPAGKYYRRLKKSAESPGLN